MKNKSYLILIFSLVFTLSCENEPIETIQSSAMINNKLWIIDQEYSGFETTQVTDNTNPDSSITEIKILLNSDDYYMNFSGKLVLNDTIQFVKGVQINPDGMNTFNGTVCYSEYKKDPNKQITCYNSKQGTISNLNITGEELSGVFSFSAINEFDLTEIIISEGKFKVLKKI